MKAIRKATLVWGNVTVPVKIMPLVDTGAYKIPNEIEVHRKCNQKVTTETFCPKCNKPFIKAGFQTSCPNCHQIFEPKIQTFCLECQTLVTEPKIEKFCPTCQKKITDKDIKVVFLVGENQLIELTEKEKKKWQETFPDKEKINVVSIIRKREINPVYFLTTYMLVPDENGECGYEFFRQALSDNELVLVVDLVITTKNYRAIISHENGRLLLITLLNYDEIVWPEIPKVKLPPELIETGKDVMFKMADRQFKPEEHARNPYREYFYALVAKKIKKQKMIFKPPPVPSPEVLNGITKQLMANLQNLQEQIKKEAKKIAKK